MLNKMQLQRLKDSIKKSSILSNDEVSALTAGLEESHRTLSSFETREQSYVSEIQRLNSLVAKLVEYVETIADIVGDTNAASAPSDEIKQRAVQMIIKSVGQIKENAPR